MTRPFKLVSICPAKEIPGILSALLHLHAEVFLQSVHLQQNVKPAELRADAGWPAKQSEEVGFLLPWTNLHAFYHPADSEED